MIICRLAWELHKVSITNAFGDAASGTSTTDNSVGTAGDVPPSGDEVASKEQYRYMTHAANNRYTSQRVM